MARPTIQPVDLSKRIDSKLQTKVVGVGPDDSDDIRKMLDASEAAAFTDLR